MASYFSVPNNTKYVFPLKILINPSILSSLIRIGFVPIKFLYEILYTKMFSYDFSSIKILSKLKSSVLVKSSK